MRNAATQEPSMGAFIMIVGVILMIIIHEGGHFLSLIHISEPTRPRRQSRMPASA